MLSNKDNKDNLSYRVEKDTLSSKKMLFTVINFHPNYSSNDEKLVKANIEKQLFAIFCKYDS